MSKKRKYLLRVLTTTLIALSILGYLITIRTDFGLEKINFAILVAALATFATIAAIMSLVSVFTSPDLKQKVFFLFLSILCVAISGMQFLGAAMINT